MDTVFFSTHANSSMACLNKCLGNNECKAFQVVFGGKSEHCIDDTFYGCVSCYLSNKAEQPGKTLMEPIKGQTKNWILCAPEGLVKKGNTTCVVPTQNETNRMTASGWRPAPCSS